MASKDRRLHAGSEVLWDRGVGQGTGRDVSGVHFWPALMTKGRQFISLPDTFITGAMSDAQPARTMQDRPESYGKAQE